MAKNKKFFALCIASAMTFISATIAVTTVAWFSGRDKIDTFDELGGAVLRSYFHGGNGSPGKPFTITTPWHYENFIKLQYSVNDFATKGYSFEFGDKILNSKTPVFFKTDVNGVVDRTATSTTLNLGGKELPPLGTNGKPFFGQVNGNNLTITNFTVDGKGYSDIGIFGYVASANLSSGETQQAKITNCYWNNFKINTKGSDRTKHVHTAEASKHNDTTEVGYLAGHVVAADSFENCYVNNCEIIGSKGSDVQNNTFSYYGKAEKDSMGGETGKGHDYEFHLDSEAIYRTVREDYEKFKNAPVRARTEIDSQGNTISYADYKTPLSGDDTEANPEIVDNGTRTLYPTGTKSGAIYKNDNQYDLMGEVRGSSADRNYSLSSLGYQPLSSNSSVKEYESFYYNNDQKTAMPEENLNQQTSWNNKSINFTEKDQNPSDATVKSAIGTPGKHYYYDSSNGWQYVENYNDSTVGTDAKNFTYNLSCPSSLEISGKVTQSSFSLFEAYVILVVDNKEICHQDITSSCKASRGSKHGVNYDLKISNIALQQSSYTNQPLKRGRHYFGFFLLFRTETTRPKYSYGCDSRCSLSWIANGKFSLSQGTFTVTQDQYDSPNDSDRVFNFSINSTGGKEATGSNSVRYGTDEKAYDETKDMPVYINSDTKQYDLYGTYLKDGTTTLKLTDSSMLWRKDEGTNTEYDDKGNPIYVHWYKWIAYFTPSMEVDYNAATYYFANDSRLTTYVKDGVQYPDRGYQYKNMDIVGGGISFYYRKILNREFKVISIRAESSSAYSCESVTKDDIGKPFYATKYCPTSIVLYLKNTANAADSTDHELGKVDFQYINFSIGGTSIIDLTTPSFKKGDANFLSLEKFGKKTGSGTVDYRTTFSCNIKETGAKSCCYCALDKNRNILGVFNANGTPSTGFLLDDGETPDVSKLLQIDTYVLALGTNSNYDLSTWVTKIDFEYKAEIGYGGTFGSVGYRDATDTIESTILNFKYDLPALTEETTTTFSIKVQFIKQDEQITVGEGAQAVTYYFKGHYIITASSPVAFDLAAYNYDTSNYYVMVGSNKYYGQDRINVNIPAT